MELLKNKTNNLFKLWKPESHPIELNNNKIIDQKYDYIHENAVKAGFVEKQEDRIYSSAKDYYTNQKGNIEIEYI